MDALDLSVNQLKRAASIKEHIEALNQELRGLLVLQLTPDLRQRKSAV
jgi:hypothetical protein